MTTNNPPIAAWAPATALAKLASGHNNAPCVLTDGPVYFKYVALIRLADYEGLQAETERLQAECAQLRAAIRRLCSIYVVDDYYDGELREDRLEAAVNRAIDATMELPQ